MTHVCPSCLHEVLPPLRRDARAWRCPACNQPAERAFFREAARYPPVPVAVVGWSGHGKTCFLGSLFLLFDGDATEGVDEKKYWRDGGFHYKPVSAESVRKLRSIQEQMRQGTPPAATHSDVEPISLHLDNFGPERVRATLVLFDTAGEWFDAGSTRVEEAHGGALERVRLVLWLVSPRDLRKNQNMTDMLQAYCDAVDSCADQSLLVVVTKGDTFLDDPDCDGLLRAYLQNPWEVRKANRLGEVAAHVEALFSRDSKLSNFVRAARAAFRQVDFAIVSAWGSDPLGEDGKPLRVPATPRGVEYPLEWAFRVAHQAATRAERLRRFRHVILPAVGAAILQAGQGAVVGGVVWTLCDVIDSLARSGQPMSVALQSAHWPEPIQRAFLTGRWGGIAVAMLCALSGWAWARWRRSQPGPLELAPALLKWSLAAGLAGAIVAALGNLLLGGDHHVVLQAIRGVRFGALVALALEAVRRLFGERERAHFAVWELGSLVAAAALAMLIENAIGAGLVWTGVALIGSGLGWVRAPLLAENAAPPTPPSQEPT